MGTEAEGLVRTLLTAAVLHRVPGTVMPNRAQLRHIEQAAEQSVIEEVRVGNVLNRDTVVGSGENSNRIGTSKCPLSDDPQVSSRPLRFGESRGKTRILNLYAELIARNPGLGNFEFDRTNYPPFADHRPCNVYSLNREILAEIARPKGSMLLFRKPFVVFNGVRIDRFVRAAVIFAISLIIALDVHSSDSHASIDRFLVNPSGNRSSP